MAPTKERPATKSIATNREARHEYFVLEALETGVELKGTEVRSGVCTSSASCRAIRWCRSRFISSMAA